MNDIKKVIWEGIVHHTLHHLGNGQGECGRGDATYSRAPGERPITSQHADHVAAAIVRVIATRSTEEDRTRLVNRLCSRARLWPDEARLAADVIIAAGWRPIIGEDGES